MKKVLLVVSLISVLLLAGCNKDEEINNNVNNNVPEVVVDNQQQLENNIISTNNDNEQNAVSDDTNLIEDGYNFIIGDANVILPKVAFSSEDADKFNKKMYELAEEIKDADGVAWGDYSYKSNIEDGKLYVLIVYNGYIEDMKYYSYIFDTSNGKMLSNVEALGQEKSNEIMLQLPKIYDKLFSETYGKLFEDEEFAKNHTNLESDNKAFMPKDINAVTYYFDSNKGAQVVLEMISIVGPSSTYKLINLNDYLND